jgi:hypothetical protein
MVSACAGNVDIDKGVEGSFVGNAATNGTSFCDVMFSLTIVREVIELP